MEYFGATIKRLRPSGRASERGAENSGIDEAVKVFLAPIPAAYREPGLDWLPLSPSDRGRLDRFEQPRRRAQFTAGRVLLRHAIEQTFGADANAWRIETLHAGGVRLVSETSTAAASISHSGELAACAIALTGGIGIDIERVRPRRTPWRCLAEAVLHPDELHGLEALDEHCRWMRLLRIWVFKEALAKSLGLGLGLGFDQVRFTPDFRSVEVEGSARSLFKGFAFAEVDCGEDVVGAVAWSPGSRDIDAWVERRTLQ